ncbi:MAG: hypothetical protein AB7C90_01405 [Bacteroidales bacterium]
MRTLFTIGFILLHASLIGQSATDSMVIRALQDELSRTQNELGTHAITHKPTYLRFVLFSYSQYQLVSNQGVLQPGKSLDFVSFLPHIHFRDAFWPQYNHSVIPSPLYRLSNILSYNSVREECWRAVDSELKSQHALYLEDLQEDKLKNLSLTPSIKASEPSLVRLAHPGIDYRKGLTPGFDTLFWKQTVGDLGKYLQSNHALSFSRVAFTHRQYTTYSVSSEQVTLQIPKSSVLLQISVGMKSPDGSEERISSDFQIADSCGVYRTEPLLRHAQQLAASLTALTGAPRLEQPYNGPVLFEKESAAAFFEMLLMSSFQSEWAAFPARILGHSPTPVNSVTSIDKRLNVTGYSDPSDSVDVEGFSPMPRIPLVREGMVNRPLTTQFSPRKELGSTGTLCYYPLPNLFRPVPGYSLSRLHVETSKGVSGSRLKKDWLSEAQRQGFDSALIVRKLGSRLLFYLVDVASGREQLIRDNGTESQVWSYMYNPFSSALSRSHSYAKKAFTSPVYAQSFYALGPIEFTVPEAVLCPMLQLTPAPKTPVQTDLIQ